jgi:hypothetical protein
LRGVFRELPVGIYICPVEESLERLCYDHIGVYRGIFVVPISGVLRGGLEGSNTPSPKFRSFEKAEPNSQFHGKYICNNLIRIQVSLVCKLSGTPD